METSTVFWGFRAALDSGQINTLSQEGLLVHTSEVTPSGCD